jgi:hypothetical protein
MASTMDNDWWTEHIRGTFTRYSEQLLRDVAARLVKPRTIIPLDELIEKCLGTLLNPPVIDRRIRELPDASRKAIAIMGLGRRSTWKVGQIIVMLASLGHAEGMTPILTLLDQGFIVPRFPTEIAELTTWEQALGTGNLADATIDIHPQVAARARGEDLGLPTIPSELLGTATPRTADGLDWLLRLSLVRQQVEESAVRLTQAHTLFKRDLTRFQTEPVLMASVAEQLRPVPEAGILTLFWAEAAGLLAKRELELESATIPESWQQTLLPTLTDLWAALTKVEPWDPLKGYAPNETNIYPTPTAGFLALLLLAKVPANEWAEPQPIADWLWSNHPNWQGSLPKEEVKTRGQAWVEAWLVGVALPLRFVEAAPAEGCWKVRLTDIGRWLFNGGPDPIPTPIVAQSLLVQPNAEILAYRQGLTPLLIGKLSRFATWKNLGAACTLELTATRTYHGLESGMTLPAIQQTLNQHSMKPVPPTVTDLIRRWADKRERITLFTNATLVEFQTAADLDTAMARGIVSIRVTDRIALTDDGRDPDFKHLRLIGNRDYEAKPQQCFTIAPDGVTMTLDTTHSDLLLEAEILRIADPILGEPPSVRKFKLSPSSLRRALDHGYDLTSLDAWFQLRAGRPTPPAARLFILTPMNAHTEVLRIVQLPSEILTDGLLQWPETSELLNDRLGPTTVSIDDANMAPLQAILAPLGITIVPVG